MKRIKDFNGYLKKIDKNQKINSGKAFTVDGADICKLASSIIDFMSGEGIEFDDGVFPTITFDKKKQKGVPAFFPTGNYNPTINEITIFTSGRALKDCLRSLAHELIHADQKLNKGWDIAKASEGIYGKSQDVEKIEADAYQRGNLMFRKWEESLRGKY